MKNSTIQWLIANKEWIFGGIGITIITGIAKFFIKNKDISHSQQQGNNQSQNVTVNNYMKDIESKSEQSKFVKPEDIKILTKILFIDDDSGFNIVKIIKNAGWKNTKMITDVSNLDDQQIRDADIFFVDINGVGVKLRFPDQGLGLAKALKEKYKDKKVVIYSAENQPLQPVFNEVDHVLKKDAAPYEFMHVIDNLSKV